MIESPSNCPESPIPRRSKPSTVPRGARNGEIRADAIYTLSELRIRMRWNRPTIARLKALGLRLVSLGRQRFVVGSDLLAIFRQLAAEQCPDDDKDEGSRIKDEG